MSDFSINDYNDSGAYQIMRGINKADKTFWTEEQKDTSIMDLADKKAQNTENKSGITVALEDFAKTTTGFHGSNSSNITPDDTDLTFFEKIGQFFGKENNNMFKDKEGQELVTENGKIYQNDIFNSALTKYDGIQYAKDGDDVYESALNFAKADIGAIEKAYQMADIECDKNGKLQLHELHSYMDYDGDAKEALEQMNLTGSKKDITAQEYASYLIAADGMIQTEDGPKFDPNAVDGLISKENSEATKEFKNGDLQEIAKQIYDENY